MQLEADRGAPVQDADLHHVDHGELVDVLAVQEKWLQPAPNDPAPLCRGRVDLQHHAARAGCR